MENTIIIKEYDNGYCTTKVFEYNYLNLFSVYLSFGGSNSYGEKEKIISGDIKYNSLRIDYTIAKSKSEKLYEFLSNVYKDSQYNNREKENIKISDRSVAIQITKSILNHYIKSLDAKQLFKFILEVSDISFYNGIRKGKYIIKERFEKIFN